MYIREPCVCAIYFLCHVIARNILFEFSRGCCASKGLRQNGSWLVLCKEAWLTQRAADRTGPNQTGPPDS